MWNEAPALAHCPHCLATNLDGEERCQDCGRPLTLISDSERRLTSRFGLGSLMLLVALVAICLAVVREIPVLGVLQLVIVLAAFIRTMQWSALRKAYRQPMALDEKIGAFISSCALVCLLILIVVCGFTTGSIVGSMLTLPLLLFFQPVPDPLWIWSYIFTFALGAAGAMATIYFPGRVLWSVKSYRYH